MIFDSTKETDHMLKTYMDHKEEVLLALSKIPKLAGHPIHKGTPRESFIREFLQSVLPSNLDFGTGEIIDCSSRPGKQRNQFDIVIYKNSYPKLDLGGGISAFLIESVVATIEVKSKLTKKELKKAIQAAQHLKALLPSVHKVLPNQPYPPGVLNFVVAYDGPKSLETAYGWIPDIHKSLGIAIPDLPLGQMQRQNTPSPTLDGLFVLGKGFIHFDNVPIGLVNQDQREKNPTIKWIICNTNSGILLTLFLQLLSASAGALNEQLKPFPYVENCNLGTNIKVGTA